MQSTCALLDITKVADFQWKNAISAERYGCLTWFIFFWDLFRYGITVPSFIIVEFIQLTAMHFTKLDWISRRMYYKINVNNHHSSCKSTGRSNHPAFNDSIFLMVMVSFVPNRFEIFLMILIFARIKWHRLKFSEENVSFWKVRGHSMFTFKQGIL